MASDKRILVPVVVLIAGLAVVPGRASADYFSCDGVPLKSKASPAYDGIQELTPTPRHSRLLSAILNQWRGEQMRAACKAKAEGRPYDMSCFHDRYDWAEIRRRLPEGYWELDRKPLRELTNSPEIRALGRSAREAWDYCVDLGVVPKGFSFTSSGR